MFNLSDSARYKVEGTRVRVLQSDGWIEIDLDQVSTIRTRSMSGIFVKLADGRRYTLDLTHLSVDGYKSAVASLKAAVSARSVKSRWK